MEKPEETIAQTSCVLEVSVLFGRFWNGSNSEQIPGTSCTNPLYLKHSAVSRCSLWWKECPGVRSSSSCCSWRVRAVRLVLDQQKMCVWRNFATDGCSISRNWRMWEMSGLGPVPRWEGSWLLVIYCSQNCLCFNSQKRIVHACNNPNLVEKSV